MKTEKLNDQTATAPREPIASELLRGLLARVFARSERFVAGRYWHFEVLFFAVLLSVLFSAGVDSRLWKAGDDYYSPAYFQKIDHPLFDVAKAWQPQTHEAKLNFRLTVPVVLHLLHWSTDERWILPVLTACAICGLIWLTCFHAFRLTGDRVCGLYAALAVSQTYIGSFGFTIYYDAIALCQLALAMLPRMHWLPRAVLVFTADFTDERAFLASPFLLVQALYSTGPAASLRQRFFDPQFLAVLGGMAAYAAGRLCLEIFAGLHSPHEGTGIAFILTNLPFYHGGVWFALKGGWLLVAIAAMLLWRRRQFLVLAGFALTVAMSLVGGFLVEDVIRSTSFVFPAFLVALLIISQNETSRWLRTYCLAAFVISAVAGNYNIWRSEITWFQPIAVKIFYCFLQFFLKTN